MDAGTMSQISTAFTQLATNQNAMGEDLQAVIERSSAIETQFAALPELFQNWEAAQNAARVQLREDFSTQLERSASHALELRTDFARLDERINSALAQTKIALILAAFAVLVGIAGIVVALLHR